MRRLLLRLVVVAVMGAIAAVMAVPAFAETAYDPAGEGAFVGPKNCRDLGPIGNPLYEVCVHHVLTPSGNAEGWTTLEGRDRDEAPDVRTDYQGNPSSTP